MSAFTPTYNPAIPYGTYVPYTPPDDEALRRSFEAEILWQWMEEDSSDLPPEISMPVDVEASDQPRNISQWEPASAAQRQALECQADILLFGGKAGTYKALSLDTPIPTPSGWVTMGGLSVGSQVFDEQGEVCRVTGMSPVFVGKRVYEVAFDDGTSVKTCGDHRWHTLTALERSRQLREKPEWKARRSANRQLTGTGKRPDLTLRNAAWAKPKLAPECGAIRTTSEISSSLIHGKSRTNHSIAIGQALRLPDAALPLDPYCLGAWLGDGTALQAGITCADPSSLDHFRAAGHPVTKYATPYGYGIGNGFRVGLRAAGVLGNKHIPIAYLRASPEQRVALLQGLMDTDGSAGKSGLVFTNTNRALIHGVRELLLTLGVKANVSTFTARCNGKDCGPGYSINFLCEFPVFRLARKLALQRAPRRMTSKRRYIVRVTEIESEPTRCITVDSPSHLYLCSRSFIPTHNSETLLVDGSIEIDNPNFNGIIFRQSFPELRDLVKKSLRLYLPLGGKFVKGSPMCWTFPSGATLWMGYMGHDDDVYAHQGAEYSWIAFDEAGHQNEHRIRYMLTRLRSTDPTLKLRMRLSANPGGPGHAFLMKMFLRGVCPHCEPSRAVESGRLYTDAVWPSDKQKVSVTLASGMVVMRTVAFIAGNLQKGDTNYLGEAYEANLMMQAASTAKMLLEGCWKVWEGQFFDCFSETRGIIFHPNGTHEIPEPDMRMVVPLSDMDVKYWYPHFVGGDYGFSISSASALLFVRLPPTSRFPDGRVAIIDEYLEPGVTARDYGKALAERWLLDQDGHMPERPRAIQMWAVSPDAWRKDGSVNDVDVAYSRFEQMNEALAPYGMSFVRANDDRAGGWMKGYQMLRDGEMIIASHCKQTIEMFQTRLRDPKRFDDVLKVSGDPLDDLADGGRYGWMTWPMHAVKPRQERLAEATAGLDPTNAYLTVRKFEIEERQVTSGRAFSPKVMRNGRRGAW